MENSSSSKTRSPARVLAAFLAAVMLFIVMPVLPVGADEPTKLQSITFVNAEQTNAGGDIFFNPVANNEKQTVNKITRTKQDQDDQNESVEWFGNSDVKGWRDGNKVTITRKGDFGDDWDDEQFTFALYTKKANAVVSYSTTDGDRGPWTPLSSDRTYYYKSQDCKVYTLPQGGMTGSIYIKVEAAKPTHMVTFSIENGATVKAGTAENAGGASNAEKKDVFHLGQVAVPEDQVLCFDTDSVKTGYVPVVSVPADLTNSLKSNGNSHTVSGITRDITVEVTLEKAKYNVTFDDKQSTEKNGYTVTIKTPEVAYNESAEFSVETKEGYNDPTVDIKIGGQSLETNKYAVSRMGSTREYTIHNVTDDVTITVTGEKPIEHTVTVAPGEGYVLTKTTNVDKVTHNGTFSFTVKPQEGWETKTPTVLANGVQVLPSIPGSQDNSWTWSYECKITTDTVITVSNFTRKMYTVTIKDDKAYTLNGSGYKVSVPYEGGFTFTLNLADGYYVSHVITANGVGEENKNAKVSVDGTSRTGSYTVTVSEVKNDFELSFEGIQQRKYTVEVTTAAGGEAKGYKVNGNFVDVSETAKKDDLIHGAGVSFTITPEPGYRIENVSVYGSDSDAALASVMVNDGNGTYSIGNVTDSYTIKVRAVAVKFTITIQSTSTTTLGKDGKTTKMPGASVTNTYTIDSDKNTKDDAKVTYKGGYYELTLPTATRPGWKLAGWKYTSGLSVSGNTLTFTGNADQSQTVIAQWTVDVDSNSESAFFNLVLKTFKWTSTGDSGEIRFEATINTNMGTDTSEGGTARVLAHGFLYGKDKDILDAAVKAENLDDVKRKLLDGASNTITALPGAGSVLYFKQSDEDKSFDLLKNGAKFSLTMRKAPNQGAGAAWVIVEFKGETYLIVSKVADQPNVG